VHKQLELIRSSGVKSNPVLLTGCTGRESATVNGDMLVHFPEYDAETAELDRVLLMKHEGLITSTIDKIKNNKLVESISYNNCKHHVISFKVANNKTEELWKILQALIDEGIYYTFSPGILEENLLLPEYMNKARAVRYIQKVANVSPFETLIAGDETNDLHMLDSKLSKYMICPNNAHSEIKKTVKKNGGIIATKDYSYGIIESVNKLLKHK
jgi:hydroxymethylpyrimidine pyrophosphatase-like HAD family hydrolase